MHERWRWRDKLAKPLTSQLSTPTPWSLLSSHRITVLNSSRVKCTAQKDAPPLTSLRALILGDDNSAHSAHVGNPKIKGAINMVKIHECYRFEFEEELVNQIRKSIELTEELHCEEHGCDRWHELKYERDELRNDICEIIEMRFKELPF